MKIGRYVRLRYITLNFVAPEKQEGNGPTDLNQQLNLQWSGPFVSLRRHRSFQTASNCLYFINAMEEVIHDLLNRVLCRR